MHFCFLKDKPSLAIHLNPNTPMNRSDLCIEVTAAFRFQYIVCSVIMIQIEVKVLMFFHQQKAFFEDGNEFRTRKFVRERAGFW